MTDLCDSKKAAFIAEIDKYGSFDRQQEDDLTVSEYKKLRNLSDTLAERALDGAVRDGIAMKYKVLLNSGHWGWVYRWTKGAE